MQPVELFIIEQSRTLQPVYKKLRQIILSHIPQIEERMVYNIPFYYLKKRIFYLNPTKSGVDLGFCQGNLLSDHPILVTKDRSRIRTINYKTLNDIIEEEVIPLIHEAVLVYEEQQKK